MTAEELAMRLHRTVSFRFLTIDAGSIRLWSDRPHYDHVSRRWLGPGAIWLGSISLDAVCLQYPIRFRESIVEVS